MVPGIPVATVPTVEFDMEALFTLWFCSVVTETSWEDETDISGICGGCDD